MFNFHLRIGHRIGSAGMGLTALIAFAALGSGTAQAAPQALALVATEGKVGLVCQGRHLAVRVSVDRAALEALGIGRIEIEIAENVALLPVPRPGDPDPITEGEAALFTGPLRYLGSLVVDDNAESVCLRTRAQYDPFPKLSGGTIA